ncbi:mannosyltransferase [Ulvibacter antarcticus]|uniref:Mannosyltransferase n=1 Tax=Ulvibacter antarcticus TaxID=442714 RepID=A0A3L9Z2S5_9FLAO|nr:mannosyltransferase [Ulvibacter antarcticus]RMA66450.1 hypothetical protein BXY75_0875 [Ulvibacter antarcticus]
MATLFGSKRLLILFAVIAALLYALFGYDLVRSDFTNLITIYSLLFLISYLLIERSGKNFGVLVIAGIVFRLVLLFVLPNLSQDFYRFLWDGRLLIEGINPYSFTPQMYMESSVTGFNSSGFLISQAGELYQGMGNLNGSHFSNYPPVNQLFFAIAGFFFGKSIMGSVVLLKLMLLLADLGILYFGKKLLEVLNLPVKNIFWYFLNPFIIIEFCGNLHFEGVMLFFVIWSIYLLHRGKWVWAAILLGVSVSVKLLPLLFLPLLFHYFLKNEPSKKLGISKLVPFYIITIAIVILTFLPFLTTLAIGSGNGQSLSVISNFSQSIALWFQNFEFNASIYYIIRWVGFEIVGWNIIGTVGKILPIITLLFTLGLAFFRKNNTTQQLINAMLFAVSFYFLLSTTVHPWYIATPLLLSIFTKYKFPIVWSFVVFLSYSAYGANGFSENLWLVALEYTIIIPFALWEIFDPHRHSKNELS